MHWLIIYTSINMTSIIHFGHRTTGQHFFFFPPCFVCDFSSRELYSLFSFLRACQQLFCPYWGMSILISQFSWILTTIFRIRDMFVLVGSKMSCAVFDLVFVFTWYVNLCACLSNFAFKLKLKLKLNLTQKVRAFHFLLLLI